MLRFQARESDDECSEFFDAEDAEEAAELYVQTDIYADAEGDDSFDIDVRQADTEELTSWTVEVELVPHFMATKRRGK